MTLMNFVWMVILGLVVGALARFFYPRAVAMNWIATAVLGIVGSLVGPECHCPVRLLTMDFLHRTQCCVSVEVVVVMVTVTSS